MTSNNKKALLLFEGPADKGQFSHLVERFGEFLLEQGYESTILGTSIYELYDPLIGEHGEAEYDSLASYLHIKGKVKCPNNVRPQDQYSLIYLIFDFDPCYHKYDKRKIIALQDYFDDETKNGRLYLNYPMVEAIFDFVSEGGEISIRRTYPIAFCNSAPYKKHIKEDTVFRNPQNGHILHYLPSNYFAYAAIKSKERYEELIGVADSSWDVCDLRRLLDKEIEGAESGVVYPLSAFPFLELDYNPDEALAKWKSLADCLSYPF